MYEQVAIPKVNNTLAIPEQQVAAPENAPPLIPSHSNKQTHEFRVFVNVNDANKAGPSGTARSKRRKTPFAGPKSQKPRANPLKLKS